MKAYLNDFYEAMDSSRSVVLLTVVLSAVCGFLYEEAFYRLDLGEWVKRGTTFGPWIPIYAIGGFLMALSTFKLRKRPLLIFLMSGLVCGLLELLAGWILLRFFGLRLWDYNTEKWNFANVGGFICFRSVFIFALFGLLQNYAMIPLIKRAVRLCPTRPMEIASAALFALFLADVIVSVILKAVS